MTQAPPDDVLVSGARRYLDPQSTEPLFQQVRRFLEQGLLDGRFRAHRPLPSTRHLAGVLGVSRNTVSAAYQELLALGLVESRPRSGLYPVPRVGVARAAADAPPPATPSGVEARPVDWDARLARPLAGHLPHAPSHADWARFRYPFLPGQPELSMFPARAWLRSLNDALAGPHLAASLRDSTDADDELLVDAVCREILPARGIAVRPDQVLITSGAQQALSLLADLALGPGAAVGVENPGYVDAWHIVGNTGATLRPLPVDSHGVRLSPADAEGLSAVYLTPSHHHPTSVTTSFARRTEILEQAHARDLLVIEDDFDSEVRYRGRPTPALASMDRSGRVIYVGTFSKFVAPGLRLGFVVGDTALIAALRARRRYVTKHPPGHLQRALGLFIDSGEYHRSLRKHRRHLARKWEALVGGLEEHLPFPVGPLPAGGLSVWVSGPEGFDGTVTARLARDEGVLVDPGERFFLAAPERHHLRLGLASIALDDVAPGTAALGRAVRAQLGQPTGTVPS